ncbi:hypothetical protein ACET3Z_008169 [Daucus carota]
MSIYVAEDTKVNKVWTELEGYIKKLVHAEVYVESKEEGNVEGASAMNRTSFLGLTGAKSWNLKDLKDQYLESLNEKTRDQLAQEMEEKMDQKVRENVKALVSKLAEKNPDQPQD